jgi:hypothetical protein
MQCFVNVNDHAMPMGLAIEVRTIEKINTRSIQSHRDLAEHVVEIPVVVIFGEGRI